MSAEGLLVMVLLAHAAESRVAYVKARRAWIDAAGTKAANVPVAALEAAEDRMYDASGALLRMPEVVLVKYDIFAAIDSAEVRS